MEFLVASYISRDSFQFYNIVSRLKDKGRFAFVFHIWLCGNCNSCLFFCGNMLFCGLMYSLMCCLILLKVIDYDS